MEHHCANCDFIKEVFIPMMMHDRCFCESGSREFVELDSVTVKHLNDIEESPYYKKRVCFLHLSTCAKIYRVMANILFSGEKNSFALIVKIHTRTMPPFDGFQNEEMFYSKMTPYFGTDIIPKCYLSDMGSYGLPIIVLEDLTARGYASVNAGELDGNHLRICVKVLATFHARGMKLRASQPSVFKEFCMNLWSFPNIKIESDDLFQKLTHKHETIKEKMFDSRSYSHFGLLEKVYKKIIELDSLTDEITDVSTICHGHFLGDNVLFGYENGEPNDAKIMDWEQLRLSTPAIDFGTVLIANLPDEAADPELETFCRDILQFYIHVVETEYPEVNCELLEQDIVAKLLNGYFITCYLMRIDSLTYYDRSMRIFRLLDRLGSLD